MKRAAGVLKSNMFAENFDAIAEAAVTAMFVADGRIDDTPSAKVDGNDIVPTRRFLKFLRQELRKRNFDIWAKHRKWA